MRIFSLILVFILIFAFLLPSRQSFGVNNVKKEFSVFDSHNDTMMKIIDEKTWLPIIDIRESTNLQIDIEKMKKY